MKLLFTFLLLSSVCLGQSKKDQIEGLNKTIDSLNIVLATARDNSAKDISSLNDKIKVVSEEVTALKGDLTNLQTSNNKLKTDLAELSKRAEKGGESNFKGLLNLLTKNDYVVEQAQAVVDVYKEMSSPQYKRAVTNYKKKR